VATGSSDPLSAGKALVSAVSGNNPGVHRINGGKTRQASERLQLSAGPSPDYFFHQASLAPEQEKMVALLALLSARRVTHRAILHRALPGLLLGKLLTAEQLEFLAHDLTRGIVHGTTLGG
jgi:hypothetical protein